MSAGHGPVPQLAEQALQNYGPGTGQPAVLLLGKEVREQDRALRLQADVSAGGYADCVVRGGSAQGFAGRFAPDFMRKSAR